MQWSEVCTGVRPMRAHVVVWAALLTVALCVPTVGGSTGLIAIPTADILPEGVVSFGVQGGRDRTQAHLGYGFGHEVEAGVLSLTPPVPGEAVRGFVKGRIFAESRTDPAMAAGFDSGDMYVVLSKALNPRFRGHIGYGSGRFGIFGGFTFSSNTVAAVSNAGMVPPQLTWMVDFTSEWTNAGVRLSFVSGLQAELAAVDLRRPLVGLTYRFGF